MQGNPAARKTIRFSRISLRATATIPLHRAAPFSGGASSPATARKISSSDIAEASASETPSIARKRSNAGVVEVGDDGVDAPAADLDPHGVEGVELRPERRARFRHPVAVADPAEARLQSVSTSSSRTSRPVLEDPDARRDPLDRGEVVRRHEDGRAAVGELADELLAEGAPRDDVEAERRVVQDEKLGGRGEREREQHLTLLPLGQPAERRLRRDAESREAPRHRGGIPPRVEAPAEVRDLPGGHGRRRVRLLRDDADAREQAAPASSRRRGRRGARGPRRASAARAGSARARTCPAPLRPRSA